MNYTGQVVTHHDLHEVDYGERQDAPRPEDCRTNLEMTTRGLCTGGESIQEVYDRARRCLAHLRSFSPEETILVVGHGTFTAMIFAAAEGLQADQLLEYRLRWGFNNCEVKSLDI